jgi:signal transduction histidine kinase
MTLAEFITAHMQEILEEWDSFAVTQQPAADDMSVKQLRNHARQILEAIALDLQTEQSTQAQELKSKGGAMARGKGGPLSAASTHGTVREASGFTLLQLTAEYRAIRASVLRLWKAEAGSPTASAIDDVIRFNEAIDQALAESVVEYSEHANRTRDTFLAVLGHDLRAPLLSVAQAGEVLVQPDPKPIEVKRVGTRIKRNAASMTALLNDLLEYARTQLGARLHINPQPANLADVAKSALHDASAAHPDCAYDLVTEGDLTGSFDALRVQQLLANLLSNAAQYRDKQYRVTLGLSGEANEVVLYVKNRGPAIPPSALEAVFNPMVRLALETTQDRPSTSLGLGLFIAREISRAHHGTIAASSSEKEGTIITVRLPRAAVPASDRRPRGQPACMPAPSGPARDQQ